MKAIYCRRAKLLSIETGKVFTNGIATFQRLKTKCFETEGEAKKYIERYYKSHIFGSTEY